MLTDTKPRMTVTDFDTWADLPENQERRLEYVGGEIIEVPSNPYVSLIAGLILTILNVYLRDNPIGWATGEGGGYMVAGERYAPDVAFISRARQPQLARKGYNPNPPDLAVEVISDPDNREEQTALRVKITNYLAAGVVVWVVDYVVRVVEVHQPGSPVMVLAANDTLAGGAILPGLVVPVQDIFPEESTPEGE